MSWVNRIRKSAATLFQRKSETARLDEEMRFHLEQEEAERIRHGAEPERARREARREFGNPTVLRDEARESWNWGWLYTMGRDLRFGARALLRSPGFAVTVIAVMALCIGATTALFTMVRAVLLNPLPFRDADRLVMVYEHFRNSTSNFPYNVVAAGDFYEWKARTHGFDDMAAWQWWTFNVTGEHGELPEVADAATGSWNLFHVLGVEPALGRAFLESEDRVGQARVAMLTWSFFQRRFQGDRSILGKQVRLDGRPYTIVGVLPEWFAYPNARVQVWVPYASTFTAETIQVHDDHGSYVVARTKPEVSLKTAIDQVSAVQYQMHMAEQGRPVAEDALTRPMIDDVVSDVKSPLWMMMAAVACMLLIGCLNVSNLLVARGAARQKELAIRGALGAGRMALVREQMTETMILCVCGGVLGLLVAWTGTHWLTTHWDKLPRAESIHLDGMVVLFAASVVCVTALLAGLVPAMSSTQRGVLSALKDSSRGASAGVSRARLRKILLSAEIALTVMLLIAAGLLLKSFMRLRGTELGIASDHVLTMNYILPEAKYSKPEQKVAFSESLVERVRHLPGVQSAALTTRVPGGGWGGDRIFVLAERPNYVPGNLPNAAVRDVDPGYFETLKIPLIAGRVFDSHDRLDQARKVIISQQLARRYFPNENPIQKEIILSTDARDQVKHYEVVGVVGDTKWSVGQPTKETMYLPILAGDYEYRITLVVRTEGDPMGFAIPVQKEFAALDPELPVVDVLTIPQIVGESTVNQSFTASLVLAFAVLSLTLAGVGLYGVLSYLVTQRVTEIGIRIALGAQRSQVLGLVLRDGLRPVFVGLAVGVGGGLAVGYVIRSLLYGTQPMDGMVLVAMVTTLLLVAALACAAPAWRASSVDPMQALRTE